MTAKVLNALAAALARSKPDRQGLLIQVGQRQSALTQWLIDVQAIEAVATQLNPRFKPEVWRRACGY